MSKITNDPVQHGMLYSCTHGGRQRGELWLVASLVHQSPEN